MASTSDLEQMEYFFQQGMWVRDITDGRRLMGVSIKIKPVTKLAVIKVISAEGPLVGFIGAHTFKDLWKRMEGLQRGEQIKWRPDQFALDNFNKKG